MSRANTHRRRNDLVVAEVRFLSRVDIDWSPVTLTPRELAQVRGGHVRPSGDPWWREASAPILAFVRWKRYGVTLKALRQWAGIKNLPARGSRPLPWRMVEECIYWLNLREYVTIASMPDGEIRIRATDKS